VNNKIRLMIAVILIMVLLVSCSGTQSAAPIVEDNAPAVEETAPAAEEAEAADETAVEESALLVGEMEFTMSQLEAMNTLEVEYTGKDDTVTPFIGVPVLDLIAEAGLTGDTVVFTASDGYEAELPLADLESCPDCVAAFDRDELRLVLPGFASNVQVKGLVGIQMVGDVTGEEPTVLVVGEMPFSMSQLDEMDTLDVEYTGKDDTVTVYTGVPLLALLSEAGLEGETIVLTASDDYQAEVSAAELESCMDCLVAFDNGGLRSVLPGFSSEVQVKDLVEISVK